MISLPHLSVGTALAASSLLGAGVLGPGVVDPVQVTPFSAKLDGLVLVAPDSALKPNDALAPVASDAFQLALFAVTWLPFCVTVAFHA